MRDIKFQFIYRGMAFSAENQERPIVKKSFSLDQLIVLPMDKLCDVHQFMDLIAKRQYTGLKDKNGVEIYEGDILRYNCGRLELVLWDDELYSFQMGCSKFVVDQEFGCASSSEVEVIGNTQENPELLEEAS